MTLPDSSPSDLQELFLKDEVHNIRKMAITYKWSLKMFFNSGPTAT